MLNWQRFRCFFTFNQKNKRECMFVCWFVTNKPNNSIYISERSDAATKKKGGGKVNVIIEYEKLLLTVKNLKKQVKTIIRTKNDKLPNFDVTKKEELELHFRRSVNLVLESLNKMEQILIDNEMNVDSLKGFTKKRVLKTCEKTKLQIKETRNLISNALEEG